VMNETFGEDLWRGGIRLSDRETGNDRSLA
jgi:hypothetical protein